MIFTFSKFCVSLITELKFESSSYYLAVQNNFCFLHIEMNSYLSLKGPRIDTEPAINNYRTKTIPYWTKGFLNSV